MNDKALIAAQGYLELGMLEEALNEISVLECKDLIPLLELQLHLLILLKNWLESTRIAEKLLSLDKNLPSPYIHGAFALHSLGKTEEARNLLLSGTHILENDPVFYYNLSCYEAILGNQSSAMRNLLRSFSLDPTYQTSALTDPDLISLRDEIKKLDMSD